MKIFYCALLSYACVIRFEMKTKTDNFFLCILCKYFCTSSMGKKHIFVNMSKKCRISDSSTFILIYVSRSKYPLWKFVDPIENLQIFAWKIVYYILKLVPIQKNAAMANSHTMWPFAITKSQRRASERVHLCPQKYCNLCVHCSSSYLIYSVFILFYFIAIL